MKLHMKGKRKLFVNPLEVESSLHWQSSVWMCSMYIYPHRHVVKLLFVLSSWLNRLKFNVGGTPDAFSDFFLVHRRIGSFRWKMCWGNWTLQCEIRHYCTICCSSCKYQEKKVPGLISFSADITNSYSDVFSLNGVWLSRNFLLL
jgi:hypothetical protein